MVLLGLLANHSGGRRAAGLFEAPSAASVSFPTSHIALRIRQQDCQRSETYLRVDRNSYLHLSTSNSSPLDRGSLKSRPLLGNVRRSSILPTVLSFSQYASGIYKLSTRRRTCLSLRTCHINSARQAAARTGSNINIHIATNTSHG